MTTSTQQTSSAPDLKDFQRKLALASLGQGRSRLQNENQFQFFFYFLKNERKIHKFTTPSSLSISSMRVGTFYLRQHLALKCTWSVLFLALTFFNGHGLYLCTLYFAFVLCTFFLPSGSLLNLKCAPSCNIWSIISVAMCCVST
jgi:hypothetical protein